MNESWIVKLWTRLSYCERFVLILWSYQSSGTATTKGSESDDFGRFSTNSSSHHAWPSYETIKLETPLSKLYLYQVHVRCGIQ
jgi:hypothetical protein